MQIPYLSSNRRINLLNLKSCKLKMYGFCQDPENKSRRDWIY